MYNVTFECSTVQELNEKLVLKHIKLTEKEIKEAIANLCLRKSYYSVNSNAKSAVEAICKFIEECNLLNRSINFYFDELIEYFIENYNSVLSVQQLLAINDYCLQENYKSESELLYELKKSGVLHENSPIEDLAECVKDETYETMYNYLVEC